MFFSSALFSQEFVVKGETHSTLGDYTIKTANTTVVLNGENLEAFIISYQNSPMEVKVVIRKENNCKKYIVLSDILSVQYTCHETYFGIERLDKCYEKEGYATLDSYLNKDAYYHQKVIGPGKRSELENTQLIATYFPLLLSDSKNNV